jgi:hypothetical protein
MNFLSKPVVALAATFVIGAGMLSPALAASNTRSQHMRAAPTYQQQTYQQQMPADAYNAFNQSGNGSWSNDRLNLAPNSGPGGRCVTDEGYGRWSYCDAN